MATTYCVLVSCHTVIGCQKYDYYWRDHDLISWTKSGCFDCRGKLRPSWFCWQRRRRRRTRPGWDGKIRMVWRNQCKSNWQFEILNLTIFLSRPDSSFMWFLNPLKSIRYIIWHNHKWTIVQMIVILFLALFILLFFYSIPGYTVKTMLGAWYNRTISIIFQIWKISMYVKYLYLYFSPPVMPSLFWSFINNNN